MKDKYRRFVPLLLLLLMLLAAGIGFPRLVGGYVIAPLASVLWAGWRVIASVDQRVYWLLLIVLCSLLTIRTFSRRDAQEPASADAQTPRRPSRVDHWRLLFKTAGQSPEGEAALRASLTNLLLLAIAQPGRPPGVELDQALAARRLSLPPGVLKYLSMSQREGSGSPVARFLRRARRSFGMLTGEDGAAIDETIRWMEECMEITHDPK